MYLRVSEFTHVQSYLITPDRAAHRHSTLLYYKIQDNHDSIYFTFIAFKYSRFIRYADIIFIHSGHNLLALVLLSFAARNVRQSLDRAIDLRADFSFFFSFKYFIEASRQTNDYLLSYSLCKTATSVENRRFLNN